VARIVENDQHRVTIDLDYGLLLANVVSTVTSDTFSVEVGDTLVTVDGTEFSIERRGTIAEVIVHEGNVIVERMERRGAGQGTRLTASSHARLEVKDEHPELTKQLTHPFELL
jgi:ferric-dicitrate binding protein FerR (iron transport regulator)